MPKNEFADKSIFGVPLHITFQKTGHVLPRIITQAMNWLEEHASDQVGVFRKPGVKSRITSLREEMERDGYVDFEEFQYFDVADMVKQYFRELPEALFTVKLSETFLCIFQCKVEIVNFQLFSLEYIVCSYSSSIDI